MANLRAGLIGLGMMGRHHARVLASLDGVELVAIADPTGGVPGAAPVAVPVVDSLDALLALGIDYAMVATPTQHHLETALALAAGGVHALIEKITTRRQGPFPGRIADVGVILDLATHDIDLTAWVAQQPYMSVAARTAHRSGRPHEDLVAITGQLADGTVSNHLVNWLSPMKERLTVITGEKGALVADTLTADLTFHENGVIPTEGALARFRGVTEGNVTRYAFAKPEPLRTEHEAFRDALLGKDSDIVTLVQAAATVAVANAAAQSALNGIMVRLDGAAG